MDTVQNCAGAIWDKKEKILKKWTESVWDEDRKSQWEDSILVHEGSESSFEILTSGVHRSPTKEGLAFCELHGLEPTSEAILNFQMDEW